MDEPVLQHPSGGYLQRTFNAGRASMSALDSRREAALRQQIKLAVFGSPETSQGSSEDATPVPTPAKLVKRNESNKLKTKRRVSLSAAIPTPSKSKQCITTTYPATHLKQYDTYAPLQVDSVAFKSLATGLTLRSTVQTGLDDHREPIQVGQGALEQPHKMYGMGPTVTVKHIHPQQLQPGHGLYSIDEQVHDHGSDHAFAEAVKPVSGYPMYSRLQTAYPNVVYQTPRRILNQPRKLAGVANSNDTMTTTSNDAYQVRELPNTTMATPAAMYPVRELPNTTMATPAAMYPVRELQNTAMAIPTAMYPVRELPNTMTASPNTMYPVRELPRLDMRISTQGHYLQEFQQMGSPVSPHSPRGYQRPETFKRARPTPDELFQSIPGKIVRLIISRLKDLHLGPGSDSCATCWMRDVASLSLASRRWSKYACIALYEDIQLVGADSPTHKKRFKLCQGGRMLLLRRTLRANRQVARLVRSLKVPALEVPAKGTPAPKATEQYDDLVSTLVMACPNLEYLRGTYTRYDHTFKRIFHALSTRSQLRQMDWLIEASPFQQRHQKAQPRSPASMQGFVVPEDLQPFEECAWLDLHANWTELTTLSIHCLPGATLTPTTLLPETLTHLPSLRYLHLCNLPSTAFNDDNLLALPRLQTLTLSHISGITSHGLSTFATRATSFGLETLTLRHSSLTSLAALARILSNLGSLKTFSLIQAFPPVMPEDDLFSLWMMPYLASASLRKLHWDITSIDQRGNDADMILAKSIAAGGFPSLKRMRVPNDPEGMFQMLCRPEERIDLPSDRFRVPDSQRLEDSPPGSPIGVGYLSKSSTSYSTATSASSSTLSTVFDIPAAQTNLRTARLAAQARLEAARCMPLFRVQVTEEQRLVNVFDMAGYIGTVGSQIRYDLQPDAGSTDEKGGVVDIRDLGGDAGESLSSPNGRGGEIAKEGCCGFWNRVDGVVADKKEREKWYHTERGRWNRIDL